MLTRECNVNMAVSIVVSLKHVHVVKPDHVQGRYKKVHHKECAYRYGTIKFGSFLRRFGTVRDNNLENIQVTVCDIL